MAINGSGVRDTGRVLQVAKGTVISTIAKQESILVQVNPNIHQLLREAADIAADVRPACDSEEVGDSGLLLVKSPNNAGFGMLLIMTLAHCWLTFLAEEKTKCFASSKSF